MKSSRDRNPLGAWIVGGNGFLGTKCPLLVRAWILLQLNERPPGIV